MSEWESVCVLKLVEPQVHCADGHQRAQNIIENGTFHSLHMCLMQFMALRRASCFMAQYCGACNLWVVSR